VWVLLFAVCIGVVHVSAIIVLMGFLLIDDRLPFLCSSAAGAASRTSADPSPA
jgi:hypothetical protein